MGVDLRLLPIEFSYDERVCYSFTVLDCDRCYELWDLIRKLSAVPVPADFTSLSGSTTDKGACYDEDPYGDRVCYVRCGDLAAVGRRHPETLKCSKNKAVWAYLAALSPEARVALYWH